MNASAEALEIVRYWIQRAEGHIAAASVLVRCAEPHTFDAACYHSHEAVATFIKALLTLRGTVIPRHHDLVHLHRSIPEPLRFCADQTDLSWLSAYGIERYWEPDATEAEKALGIALRARAGVLEILSGSNGGEGK